MSLSEGTKFPEGVEFSYIPIEFSTLAQDDGLVCAKPLPLKLDKLFKDHSGTNAAFVFVPGAFTPTCTEDHIPGILKQLKQLKKEQNIGVVVIASANDPFVINAWGKLLLKQLGISESEENPKIIFASDGNASFSGEYSNSLDLSSKGFGVRTARYAFIVGQDQTIKYFGKEEVSGVNKSGIDALLNAKL